MHRDQRVPTTMTRCAFYPIADITFQCWVLLNSCYRNWMYCVSHFNTWTVFIHSSGIDTVEILLSTAEKSLIMCREQCSLIEETKEWTEYPASHKSLLMKNCRKVYLALSKRQNQHKPVNQSLEKEPNK